jgi:hypothetical protein
LDDLRRLEEFEEEQEALDALRDAWQELSMPVPPALRPVLTDRPL